MSRKIVSTILLFLLLISTLTLAYKIRPVKADGGTIYIRADGSIDPLTAPIYTADNITYTLTGNITTDNNGIIIERANIVLEGAGHMVQGTGDFIGIDSSSISNVTIEDLNIEGFRYGIWLTGTSGSAVCRNNGTDNGMGIRLESSTNTIACDNNETFSQYGIVLEHSSNCSIFQNSLTNNLYYGILFGGTGDGGSFFNTIYDNAIAYNGQSGIWLYGGSSNNSFYHNNIVGNVGFQAHIWDTGVEHWDNGYPFGGNYWSDYSSNDVKSGPNQDQPGSDGIGDTPKLIDDNNKDNFPLMQPWNTSSTFGARFNLSISPSNSTTSIGGTATFDVAIANYYDNRSDKLTLSVQGVDPSWYSISKNSFTVIPGETEHVELDITVPENLDNIGAYPFNVTVSGISTQEGVNATLNVVQNPLIYNLEPDDNTTLGTTSLLASWTTSSNASSEIYIKATGDPVFEHFIGAAGTYHCVSVNNLTRNMDFVWYAYSETANGNVSSDLRTLQVSNGVSFSQRNYTFNVQRDYAQQATISVNNTDTVTHDCLLQAINPYDDLIVGFVGPGSTDENLTLAPGETVSVAFNIFAQDATQQNYTFTIKLTNLEAEQITDYALVNVNVRQPNINLIITEGSTDPLTLTKTITATNYGDPITDLYIDASDELAGEVSFNPTVCHADLLTGESLTFQVMPVLTTNFTGIGGLITATSAGQVIATLPVNFTLPPGNSVYSITIPQVSIAFDDHYDTDDSPNTNPLPSQAVESYLANGTLIFASQIIVDVFQNNTPAYGANVSLTVWDSTGAVISVGYCDSDTSGKVLFNVVGGAGNYSYQAELVDFGIHTERRNFYVADTPLFEIHPKNINWLDVSDANTTIDLSGNVTSVILNHAPFVFRGSMDNAEENATINLLLTWTEDIYKKIYIPGSIQNDTLVFQTSYVPMGNFSATIIYYSPNSGLSVSQPLHITNNDPTATYMQGNYTYYLPFPLNSTYFMRLTNQHCVTSRDPEVAFDLSNIEPTNSNTQYLLTYMVTSNETAEKTFQICIDTTEGELINYTFILNLEPQKTVEVNFTLPVTLTNGSLLSEFNSTLSTGSSSVSVLTNCSPEYIYDTMIWVGSQNGVRDSLVSPANIALMKCGSGIVLDYMQPGAGIALDAAEFATTSDNNQRGMILIKYGLAIAAGVVAGIVATPVAGYYAFETVLTLGDIYQCYTDWQNVRAQRTSIAVGQCKGYGTSVWYCTNRPVVSAQISMDPVQSDVIQAAAVVKFTLPWPMDTYRPHNVHLFANDIEIGTLTNTIPNGYYIFPFNSSILNYVTEGIAQNTITMKMDDLNGGHYVVTSDWQIILYLKQLTFTFVAANQTEADSTAEQLAGTGTSISDFAIYPENIACPNPQPKEGQSLIIAPTIFNFGTVGMIDVPVDLYVDSVKVNSAIIGFLPALANQTVDFGWIATRGTHNVTIVVNSGQLIPESDYTNNQAQTSITVLADNVAIANIGYVKNVVGRGFLFNESVTAANRGDFTETFNVTVYANTTSIMSQNVTLPAGNSTTVTFTWNTTGFAYGNYTISAYACPVPGETNTADNNCTGGWVIVSIVGDITGPTGWPDGTVNMRDVAIIARCFGSTLGSSNWNPNTDLNNDGIVNMKDIALVARHFGNHV